MKNVELYEFVQKLAKKKKKKEKKESWVFNPGPIWLAIIFLLLCNCWYLLRRMPVPSLWNRAKPKQV